MVKSVIGNGQLASYTPVQAVETLDKALREISLLEVQDCLGYRKLNKIAKRK